jgi:translation elongation factor EF-1beta
MSNALLNTLTEALGDGFMPTALQSVMSGEFDVSAPNIDVSQAAGITGPLASLDLTSLSGAVGSVQQSGLGGLSNLPGVGTLVQPVSTVLQFAGQIETADVGGVITRLQQAAENSNTANALGLEGVDASIKAVFDLQGDSGLSNLLALGSSLLPINFSTEAGNIIHKLDGVTVALKVLGSLMSLHASFEKTSEISASIDGLLVPHEIEQQRLRLIGWKSNTTLAAQISAVPADDRAAIDRLSRQVHEFINDVHVFTASLQKGLGFGDAALSGAGLDALEQTIDTVSNTLLTTRLDPALALSTAVRNWLTDKLPADFGSPAASIDAVVHEMQGLADDLEAQINSLPVERMVEPVTNAVGQVTTVVSDLNNALATATGAIRSAFEHARQLIDSLNLAGIAETIAATLRPVVQVIEQLESFIAGISTSIQQAMTLAAAAVRRVKEGILSGAGEVADAFAQVESVLVALDMESLINGMKTGIQAVVDALKKIDLDPYFDTAVDAMDTVSSIIDAVPLELLPDDMEADLQNAVQPVKSIDFDRDVRQILILKLEQILDKVDADILGEIDRMAGEIVTFLQQHDPQEKLEELEKEYFDPMLATILAINPEEILKPVTDVIDTVKEHILAIDLRALVVDQIDGVFDDIIAYYDQCDPEPLLAPVVDEVDAFRLRIIELTGIDGWANHIDSLEQQLTQWLDTLDFTRLINELDTIYTSMLRSLGNDAGNTAVMGGFIAGLLSGSVSLRSSSYSTVLRWISGAEDGVETVHDLIGQSLGKLQSTLSVVDSLQPDQVVAAIMPCYRGIRQAVEGLAADHPLRLQLELSLASSAPADLLAGITANLPGYRTQIDTGIKSLQRLETSGFSQITAAGEALRNVFQPLVDVQWKLIVLVRRFGIDPVGKPLMVVIGELLAALRPGSALEPFTAVVEALKTQIHALITALVVPIKEAVSQIQTLLDTINIKLISDELKAVHTQIRTELLAFRPSVLLAEPLDAFDDLRGGIEAFDPLAAVRTVIDEFKEEAEELLGPESLLRPSVMFAGLLEQYQRILSLADQLNVRDALQPVLAELDAIKEQLDDGLSETGEAFTRLQGALP